MTEIWASPGSGTGKGGSYGEGGYAIDLYDQQDVVAIEEHGRTHDDLGQLPTRLSITFSSPREAEDWLDGLISVLLPYIEGGDTSDRTGIVPNPRRFLLATDPRGNMLNVGTHEPATEPFSLEDIGDTEGVDAFSVEVSNEGSPNAELDEDTLEETRELAEEVSDNADAVDILGVDLESHSDKVASRDEVVEDFFKFETDGEGVDDKDLFNFASTYEKPEDIPEVTITDLDEAIEESDGGTDGNSSEFEDITVLFED